LGVVFFFNQACSYSTNTARTAVTASFLDQGIYKEMLTIYIIGRQLFFCDLFTFAAVGQRYNRQERLKT